MIILIRTISTISTLRGRTQTKALILNFCSNLQRNTTASYRSKNCFDFGMLSMRYGVTEARLWIRFRGVSQSLQSCAAENRKL